MVKSGIDNMLDSIKNRDNDDPMGLKNKKKEMIVKNPTQKTGGGFDDLIDRINERDADDPTGTKKPKKKEEKTPLDGITKTTTDLVTAGIGAVVGIGVMKGMSGMLNNK